MSVPVNYENFDPACGDVVQDSWWDLESKWFQSLPGCSSGKPLTICVDFDGVLHRYTKYNGLDVFDGPVDRAPEAMRLLKSQGHTLILYTTRAVTPALKKWLFQNGIPIDHFNENPARKSPELDDRKPLADIYIDDRGLKFEGDWVETLAQVQSFKLWFK